MYQLSNVGIVIQCRDNATRLPLKSVKPFYGTKSILEILHERFSLLGFPIIVATSFNSEKTIEICKYRKYKHLIGNEENVLGRFTSAAVVLGKDYVIRVCADNPFASPCLVFPLLQEINEGYDYIAFKNSMLRQEGLFCEIIKVSALVRADNMAVNKYDREHVTPYIYNNKLYIKFKVKLMEIPKEMDIYPLRLTVDTESDFNITQKIYEDIKEDWWGYIYGYLLKHKKLYEEMIKNIEENPKSEMQRYIL